MYLGMKLTVLCSALFVSASLVAGNLEGQWEGKCLKFDQGYAKTVSTVSGANVVSSEEIFMDKACNQSAAVVKIAATYQEGAESKVVKGATEIDSTLSKISFTATDERVAGYFNSVQFCGFSDWKAGEEKDITALTCEQTQMPKSGDRYYNIYSVNESTLMMGKTTQEFDASSPEKRPQELDTVNTYTKK